MKSIISVIFLLSTVQVIAQSELTKKDEMNRALNEAITSFEQQSNWSVYSATDLKKRMDDSLWAALTYFEKQVKVQLENKTVSESDIKNLVQYCYENFSDSVYSSINFLPVLMPKDSAIKKTNQQFQDIVGESNCSVKFVSWDGWDGKCPWTMARYDILHHGYIDQALIIINTNGEISSLFSTNSEGSLVDE
jgi:hypothetical protein